MIDNSKLAELLSHVNHDFENFSNLPFPVLVTDMSGTFLKFNTSAKELLGLEEGDQFQKTIHKFYHNDNWKQLICNLEKRIPDLKEKEFWETENITTLLVKSNTISVKFNSKAYLSASGELLGILIIINPIAEVDEFYQLQNKMSIGIFEIKCDWTLANFNKKFADLTQLTPDNKIQFKEIFEDINQYERVFNKLKDAIDESYESGAVVIKKKDDKKLLGTITLIPQYDEERNFIKAKGILRDLTNHEILDKAPIGIHLVINSDEKDVIMKVNKEWANIMEFESPEDCVGIPVNEIFQDEKSHRLFLKALLEASDNNKILKNYRVEIKTKKGNLKILRVTAKEYKNFETNTTIGRIGIIIDVTNDIEESLVKWKKDFAGFLHSYANMVVSMRETINTIIKGHGTDVIKNRKVDLEAAYKNIELHINGFSVHLEKLLTDFKEKNIPFENERIERAFNGLKEKSAAGLKEKAAWIRLTFIHIRKELESHIKNQKVNREIYKEVQNDIAEILRFTRLISLSLIIEEIAEVLADLNNFKAILMDGHSSGAFTKQNLVEILNRVINSLEEFSQLNNVAIKKKIYHSEELFTIEGNTELHSAFYNIIHNAIKYSRRDNDFSKSWVNVSMDIKSGVIEIMIDNLGVPIRQKELNERLIFDFGFRGAESHSEGRKGSGIGLWHANRIITDHGGKIEIISHSTNYNRPDDYSKWFKTIVTITFKK